MGLTATWAPWWWVALWLGWWVAAIARFYAARAAVSPPAGQRALPERTAAVGVAVFAVQDDPPRANAAVMGFGRRRRVVVTETLLRGLTPEQVAAVVAHEVGHVRGRHHELWLLGQGTAGLAFFAVWGAFGPLSWWALTAPLWALALRLPAAALRRRWEYAADAFAAASGHGPALAEALAALERLNGRDAPLSPSSLDRHPPAAARIARLQSDWPTAAVKPPRRPGATPPPCR